MQINSPILMNQMFSLMSKSCSLYFCFYWNPERQRGLLLLDKEQNFHFQIYFPAFSCHPNRECKKKKKIFTFHFYYLFPNFLSKPTNPPSFLTHFRMINWRAPQESGSLPNTPLKAAITTTQRRKKENNEKKKKNPNKPMSKIPKSYGVDWLLCGFKVWSNLGFRSFGVNGLQINLGFLVLIC